MQAVFVTLFLFIVNVMISIISSKIRPLKIFDDNKTDIEYVFNIVCIKSVSEKVKSKILSILQNSEDINIDEIKINNITEDKVRINIEINLKDENIMFLESIINSISDIQGVFSKGWTKTNDN